MDTAEAPGRRDALPSVQPGLPDARGRPLVLVCDDSAGDRALLRVNLELEGCRVIEASDGDEVLSLLHGAGPRADVITLDAVMPRNDGWHATAQIRSEPALAGIPIIMVSASTEEEDVGRAERAGVDAFVSKPFEPAEIVELVLRLARRPRG